ncbi:MAG: DUF1045 domain-containing protein [Pseudomonadota bacterium]
MPEFERYAVYYAPPKGSALARFGAAWLGWDIDTGAAVDRLEVPGLPVPLPDLTARARRYGFHGTLKPPFFLSEGTSADALATALSQYCRSAAPVAAPPLRLRQMGHFFALVPDGASEGLVGLAAWLVEALDAYRAPPRDEEVARRRSAGLSARQDANLVRWGYPYVMDEFRFHLTLTDGVPIESAPAIEAALLPLVTPLTL